MPNFDDIRDPIVRIFATEIREQLESTTLHATFALHSARRSLNSNPRVPSEDKTQATDRYFSAEQLRYKLLDPIFPSDLKESLDQIRDIHQSLGDSLDFFRSSRRHFQRYTSIDSSLRYFHDELSTVGHDIDRLRKAAIENDEQSRKQIYESVLGKKLDQLDAPYLFEVINFFVELTNPPNAEISANASEGLALLVKEAHDLAASLIQTNVDRRFLSAINEYITALTETNFSPIKVDLFSNRLRFYLIEMKDELPGFAIAEVSALLLSQERVLRQFPAWRDFETDASRFSPDEQTSIDQQKLLESIASETKNAEGVASNGVLDAFDRLLESSSDANLKDTAALGIWRSVENFLKTNIRYVIGAAKTLRTNITANQLRYIKYLERIVPYLKLYVRMDEKRAWLLPVIQWLEDTLKTVK
jgi:hypothetical protein